MHQLRQGVGQATRADIMYRYDRVGVAKLPTTVDDFLATALHFRVAALHRGKVECFVAGAARHRRGGAATQTNQHRRATQHYQLRTRRNNSLGDVAGANRPYAARDHDGFVVAAQFHAVGARHPFFVSAEVAA